MLQKNNYYYNKKTLKLEAVFQLLLLPKKLFHDTVTCPDTNHITAEVDFLCSELGERFLLTREMLNAGGQYNNQERMMLLQRKLTNRQG